jgi:hypothetical protein
MRRREFVTLFGAAAAWPLVARAQQSTTPTQAQQTNKLPRIAFLTSTSPENSPTADGFRQGLHDLGYVEGLKLTRFRGHQRICVEGVHDAKQAEEARSIPA